MYTSYLKKKKDIYHALLFSEQSARLRQILEMCVLKK